MFRQHTCYIRNLEGVDLLSGSRWDNLYTLSLRDMMASSPICLLLKASKTKSWLWHRRLSHLNFRAINHLARHGLFRGLPKLKFEKDHLCSACALGKSTKKPHKPKSEDTNQEKLYLLHMDLCGPMRVASVNGEKYIFLKMIQLRLKVPVRHIKTDNGTEFVNQTLREYYEKVGISHETSVARSLLQNGVAERQNHFDELTVMASEHSSSGPTLHEMTPATINLGLVPNPPHSTPVDHPAPEFVAPVDEVAAPVPAISTGLPSSTIIDQDAPSQSNSQTTPDTQPLVIPNDVEEDNHDIEVAHMGNDPYFGIPIPEVSSDLSSSPVSTRLQLHKQARFCYYDAFLTAVEPKTYKDALTQACWIEAMQEELNEFKRLEDYRFLKVLEAFINQSKYALESLKKYGFDSCDPVDTPMVEKSKLDEDKEGKAVDPSHYHGMIGTLLYLTASRPDLQFAICMCARYQARPTEKHLNAMWDHAGCQDTRHSTSTSMQFLGDRLISWSLKRQKSVAISSREADYITLSGGCAQILWMRSQLTDYGFGFNKISIFHFFKEHVENGVIKLYFVNTKYQLANIFIKALGRERIEFLINKFGMRSFTPETLKQLADEVDE
ncbi:retrovirus-related pol polyprotein from transposon TNT 1-94 [Tanacetum coccineum]